jgi:adenylate cyclase
VPLARLRGKLGALPSSVAARFVWPLLALACLALPFATKAIPLTLGVEHAIHDLYRYLLAPTVETAGGDPDIALVLYDDAAARDAGRTNPVDRARLAAALKAIEGAGARSVGIDMIFIQPTEDEDALIDALATMRIPVYLAYADPERDHAAYWDPAIDGEARTYQDGFWRRIRAGPVTRVSPVVATDDSGLARSWPDVAPGGNPPLAWALAGERGPSYRGAIGFTRLADGAVGDGAKRASGMFPTFSIDLVTDPDLAEFFLPELAGRRVLVGSDTFNADQLATPITRIAGDRKIAGVTVHAQMLRQALDRRFPAPLPWWGVAALAALFAAGGAASAMIERRPVLLSGAALLQLAALAALPLVLDRSGIDFLGAPLFGFLMSWLLAFLAVSYALRSRTSTERAFARDALGRFLPENVAREILDKPELLGLSGEQRALFMMFTDLEGFTRFSHGRDPQVTAAILNRYLEEMSTVVLDHGGTIDKYVGDALVAFWGAPLAGDEDGNSCVACALALHRAAERLRAAVADEYGETVGRTRIGLHHGSVVVGNFGGRRRIQYTALGDAMNVAARLEGANKYLASDILASEAVRKRAPDFSWRPLGPVVLSGVNTPIALYEPVADERRSYTSQWADAMKALIEGNSTAAGRLRSLAREHPSDRALASLVARLERIKGGGAYVLETK